MENLLAVLCIPIIIAIVYAAMSVYKHVVRKHSEVLTRIVPLWSAILGAILGIYGFYRVPSIMLGDNLLVALIVGLAAGLAAVGLHQVGKQLGRPTVNRKEFDTTKNESKTDSDTTID